MSDIPQQPAKQLLHLVFGGELKSVASMAFPAPMLPGKRKRRVPSTTPKCDTSSCICIGSLTRRRWHRRVEPASAVDVE
jgi:hypothetical protein